MLNEKIDDEDATGSLLEAEKEQVEEAKLLLITVEEELKGLVDAVNQQLVAWQRLETELKALETLSLEHRFQAQLAEVRGHVSLERLKAALLAIKVGVFCIVVELEPDGSGPFWMDPDRGIGDPDLRLQKFTFKKM
jgi:hypothetical protein